MRSHSIIRIVFALPSSSAQIKHDFDKNSLRTFTTAANTDMCSFLSQNRHFVDVCQCPKLKRQDLQQHIRDNWQVEISLCLMLASPIRKNCLHFPSRAQGNFELQTSCQFRHQSDSAIHYRRWCLANCKRTHHIFIENTIHHLW
ncbi:hypothetical protein GQ600_23487 [Phytophthora cactorum]|nr:hypothetical protein GQ600_23487 [Phytophthora cactorum]